MNAIPFGIFPIHAEDWLARAQAYEVILGICSCKPSDLEEIKRKYYLLENHMHKQCYPSYHDVVFYEDKIVEAYLSQVYGLPFIRTRVYNDQDEALAAADTLVYPIVSKVVPSSGSVGVELVKSASRCGSIIRKAFSRRGRGTHVPYAAQKNYVYFQDYVRNDGYDIRVIVVGDKVFGYYRKVPRGDFRASGRGMVEKRELPGEAMRIARRAYDVVKSPMLVVDMLKSLKGEYFIIEMSPICRVDTPEQLHVDGVPGCYVARGDSYSFQPGRFWVDELALKEFFQTAYRAPSADGGGRVREGQGCPSPG